MVAEVIFSLVGGLGLFFLGMKTMSDALRKAGGERFRNALEAITRRPILGLLAGAAVATLIQSSSATTVMTVGFVNAGLLTLRQAISVILGANIGTTMTAWLISLFSVFKITAYALPAIGVGYLMTLLGRTPSLRRWGQFILGFGLLFVGLSFIGEAFGPLQQDSGLQETLAALGDTPLLGVLAGMLATIILQSSSATIGMVQLMAFSGLIGFDAAIPIILGENIGTTITAYVASIGTSTDARRAARAHALLNVIGVGYMLVPVWLGWYGRLIELLIPGPLTRQNVMVHIALAHTTFNVINSFLIFLPLIGLLEKLTVRLTRVSPDELPMRPQFLERHLLDTPSLAIPQAVRELVRMLGIAREATANAVRCFLEGNLSLVPTIQKQEDTVDLLQKEITQYLVEVSSRRLEKPEAEMIPVLIHSVNDAERLGDHAENIMELAQRKAEQRLPFTPDALEALGSISGLADTMMQGVLEALEDRNAQAARAVLVNEEELNRMQNEMKAGHIQRMQEGSCHLVSGLLFMDMLTNLEKIGDHLTNIAQGCLRHMRWDMEMELRNREKNPEED